jgi:hypothetical protein
VVVTVEDAVVVVVDAVGTAGVKIRPDVSLSIGDGGGRVVRSEDGGVNSPMCAEGPPSLSNFRFLKEELFDGVPEGNG